jgi:hypothetical protein
MRQLFPSPVDPVDPADVYGDPPRAGPGGRPGVRLNMIASVDGATTVAGVSGAWAAAPTTSCSPCCARWPTWSWWPRARSGPRATGRPGCRWRW